MAGPTDGGPGFDYFSAAPSAPRTTPQSASTGSTSPFGTIGPGDRAAPRATDGTRRRRSRRRLISSAPVRFAVVVVLVLGAVTGARAGWHAFSLARPVSFPESLDSLDPTQNSALHTHVDELQKALQQLNPGLHIEIQDYGDPVEGHIIQALVAKGRPTVSDLDVFGKRHQIQPEHQVGSSTCASSVALGSTVCIRSEGERTVAVSFIARENIVTEQHVAELVDQVWASA